MEVSSANTGKNPIRVVLANKKSWGSWLLKPLFEAKNGRIRTAPNWRRTPLTERDSSGCLIRMQVKN